MARVLRPTAALVTLTLAAGALVATAGVGAASAAAVTPVAGGQTSGDVLFPNQGNSGYDALHYDIDLTVDVAVSGVAGAVSSTTFPAATTTVTAATTGAPLSSYSFDFQGSTGTLAAATLNVDSVTVNGVAATFSRIENTTPMNALTDNHKLIVTPAEPVDGTFTTVVKYSGKPVAHTDADGTSEGWNNTTDGATFVNQPVGSMTAFPNNNTPSDKATYTISVNAPSKLHTSATAGTSNPGLRDAAVASNGELVSKTPSADGSRTTWVWDQKRQMASMSSLISLGRYDVYESDVTLASGRTLHEWSFIDPSISAANQAVTQATRAQFKTILDSLEAKYGAYPGGSLGVVTDVVPGAISYALETQDRSFFPNSASRGTTVHELTHQWFGDGISPKVWNDLWISEGTATYAETMVGFETFGSSSSTEATYYAAWNSSGATGTVWTIPTANMTGASVLFGSQVYSRGAWTLEALRTAIGADAFAALMAEWQSRYQGQSHGTADFIALAEEVSGRSLTAFFQPWLYGNTKAPWPAKFNLTLSGPNAPLGAGETGAYTLTNRNTGRVAQSGSVVTVDLSKVLDKATLGTLPANTSLSGTTLTWNVPATAIAATSSVSFDVTPNAETSGQTLTATARASTLGSTCIDCTQNLVIGKEAVAPAPVPTISGLTAGAPLVGTALTADATGWPEGTTFSYQWLVDGTPVTGATSSTFTPTTAAATFPIAVKVTGRNGSLTPVTVTSAPTAATARQSVTAATFGITGTPQFGKKLVPDLSGWTPGSFFTYQWAVNGANVSNANGGLAPTFTPTVASQLNGTVTVTVTGTKPGYTSLVKASTATTGIVAGEFVATPTPSITGSGKALAAASTNALGAWDDGTTLSYQWVADGVNVSTAASYTPPIGAVGTSLYVTVTGTKVGYAAVSRTSATQTVLPAAQVLTPTPTVAGTAKVGVELTATVGTWDAGTSLQTDWLVGGNPVSAGSNSLTYTPTSYDVGQSIAFAVTSTRGSYDTVTKTSSSSVVAPGDLALTPIPTVTGTAKVGVELVGEAGEWDADELAYQWAAGGIDIEGADSAEFTPGAAQAGLPLTFSVTGSKYGYASLTKTSLETEEVELGDLDLSPVPTITGVPKVGEELTAVAGTWDDGVTFSYQWFADGEEIDGATESTYTPGPAKVDTIITVEVTGGRDGYAAVTVESLGTAAVAPAALVTTPIPTIAGTPKVGVLLTALPGTWDVDTEFTYEWFADGEPIEGADESEFTPTAGELGAHITVEVTGVKLGHTAVTKLSIPTAAVVIGTFSPTPKPTVTGIVRVGATVTADTSDWDDRAILTYQWRRDGNKIAGATDATYRPMAADYRHNLSVTVTAKQAGFTTVSVASARTKVTVGRMTLSPTPVITGEAKVGKYLKISATYDTNAKKSYTWYANGKKVGSNKSSLKLTKAMKGKKISVTIAVSKPGYSSFSRSSASTAKVQ